MGSLVLPATECHNKKANLGQQPSPSLSGPHLSMEGCLAPPLLVLLFLAREARAGINEPMKEWLCNYCAMGPQENPDDCGTPILCMFYGLLLGILALTIYTTIKGTTE